VEADHLTKGFGDRLLIEDLSFSLPRGGIVGVIGPNGAGKTTLFRMITGADKPDDGELRVGSTVQLGYVDQSRETLDAARTAYEGDSQVRWFEGNFSDYETDRKKRLGAEAAQPHRIKYKPLVR